MAVLQRKFFLGNGNTQEYLYVTANFRHGTNEKVYLIPVISDANKVSINNNPLIFFTPKTFATMLCFHTYLSFSSGEMGVGVEVGYTPASTTTDTMGTYIVRGGHLHQGIFR